MADKIVDSKNSSFISLVPTTQTTFTENGQMIFEVDESLGYIKGRDSYLVLNVKNTSSDFSRWSFPNGVGASALIKRLEIYSRSTGQLLEALDNYNQWCGIENQYLRDDYSMEQREQGVGTPNFQWVNGYTTAGAVYRNTAHLDPTLVVNSLISPIKGDKKNPSYATRQFVVPIKSGIFSRWWDSEKLCPVLNFGGLRMVFTFAPNDEVCKRLGYKGQLPADDKPGLVRSLIANGIKCLDQGSGSLDNFQTDESEEEGYFTDIINLGLVIGQSITVSYTGGGGGSTTRTITNIETMAPTGRVKITCDNPSAAPLTGDLLLKVDTTKIPSFKVESAELRVLQMVVPKDGMDKLAKPMKYEFTSYDQFFNTLPTSVLRHQVPITSVASKGRSIFTHFVDSSKETTQDEKSYYSGQSPTELNLTSVQLFINNRLYPLQSINPQKYKDKPLMLNELVKAMTSINKLPLNLGSNEKGQLEDYSNTFLYSRELARGDFVYNLQNAEPEVRLGFSGTRATSSRVNSFVFSRKVVDISPQGLMVEL
ncbi:MAG: hypothetical protein ACXAAH_14940 [Promethearchaeota archaeon]|jgi:hypothetical protein